MSQFELVEDYLTNRLDEGAKKAFEQQVESNPQLKAEVNLQKSIIEGVKSARVAELKAMLNNVPVGGSGASSSITGKIALGTISAGIIGTLIYFGVQTESVEESEIQEQSVVEQQAEPSPTPESPETITAIPEKTVKIPSTQKSAEEIKKVQPKAASPKIDVLDLTQDLDDNTTHTNDQKPSTQATVSASSVEVELDNTHKAYPFHYQFKDEKLVLYGPFDSSLYEIIEINGGTHTLFMYYKNSYYHLDEKEKNVVPLIMIRDLELLDKLEEYRNKN